MAILILIIFVYFIFSPVTSAESAKNLRQEIRENVREEIREGKESGSNPAEIRNQIKVENQGLIQELKKKVKELKFGARVSGSISSIGTNEIVVLNEEGKSYQVFITEKTVLERRFWGRSSLSEFSAGDKVNVIGSFKDEGKTQIEAKLVRNLSIQKRFGVFIGDIKSIDGNSFVMQSVNRGDQTVTLSDSTKLTDRKEQNILSTDLKVGHRVRVKGMWDSSSNKITEVTFLKDFSLPVKGSTPTKKP